MQPAAGDTSRPMGGGRGGGGGGRGRETEHRTQKRAARSEPGVRRSIRAGAAAWRGRGPACRCRGARVTRHSLRCCAAPEHSADARAARALGWRLSGASDAAQGAGAQPKAGPPARGGVGCGAPPRHVHPALAGPGPGEEARQEGCVFRLPGTSSLVSSPLVKFHCSGGRAQSGNVPPARCACAAAASGPGRGSARAWRATAPADHASHSPRGHHATPAQSAPSRPGSPALTRA